MVDLKKDRARKAEYIPISLNTGIQLRELYCAGERGEYWLASKYSYENTETRIKMKGQLSRSFSETLGCKQGLIKSSDNYKIYINQWTVQIWASGSALSMWAPVRVRMMSTLSLTANQSCSH